MSRLPAVLVRLKLRGLFCETAHMTELPASKIRVEWPLSSGMCFPRANKRVLQPNCSEPYVSCWCASHGPGLDSRLRRLLEWVPLLERPVERESMPLVEAWDSYPHATLRRFLVRSEWRSEPDNFRESAGPRPCEPVNEDYVALSAVNWGDKLPQRPVAGYRGPMDVSQTNPEYRHRSHGQSDDFCR